MPRLYEDLGFSGTDYSSQRSPVMVTPGGGGGSSGTKKVGASGSLASTR
jgi:hypothetical protein